MTIKEVSEKYDITQDRCSADIIDYIVTPPIRYILTGGVSYFRLYIGFSVSFSILQRCDVDRLAKSNWMRDDEIRAYEEECKRTYVPKKYTKYAGKELLYHTGGYKLLFILHTGLRVGEAFALTWADYDDFSKTTLVDKNMVYVDGEKKTQTPKTESGERVIVLNKQAVMDLQMLHK